jgi:hypothetical protein
MFRAGLLDVYRQALVSAVAGISGENQVAPKSTKIKNISLDWDDQSEARPDVTRDQWETGVTTTIGELFAQSPCETSRAVLTAIESAAKLVTIVPERQPLLPGLSDANASANPVDPQAATRPGGTPERGAAGTGTGGGSGVRLTFTPQDWERSTSAASLRARDETLLHELVHACRQIRGLENSGPISAPFEVLRRGDGTVVQLMTGATAKPTIHSQIYNDSEEFIAILITNIYRSENGRQGLRRDHLGGNSQLVYPLTNARNFLTVWRPQIARLCAQMKVVCDTIAQVPCHFNPIFELYAAENRFAPGSRALSR